jgi:hypothetical protein
MSMAPIKFVGGYLQRTEGVGEIREAYIRCSVLREDPDAPSLHFTTALKQRS